MQEYFVTYLDPSRPDCYEGGQGKDCFTSACDQCNDKGPQCPRENAYRNGLGNVLCGGPDCCLTEPCEHPKTKEFSRVVIGSLTEKERNICARKAGIQDNPDFVWGTTKDLKDIDADLKHKELVKVYTEMDRIYRYRHGNQAADLDERNYPRWFLAMKVCKQTARKIQKIQSRTTTPVATSSTESIDRLSTQREPSAAPVDSVPKPANNAKTGKKKGGNTARKPRPKKYEAPVEEYLINLREGALQGTIPQARVEHLSYNDIADSLAKKDEFKGVKIETIKDKVRRTDAWKNRKGVLAAVYDTGTSRNRKTGNSPYQDVQ